MCCIFVCVLIVLHVSEKYRFSFLIVKFLLTQKGSLFLSLSLCLRTNLLSTQLETQGVKTVIQRERQLL